VSALGHISGGHFNAVTFGFFVTRRMEPRLAAAFWFFQLAGAVIAALLLSWLLPQSQTDAVNLGAPAVGSGVSAGAGMVVELILTSYWVGPLIGGALAALAYEHLYLRTLGPEPPGPPETGLEEPRPGDAASI